MTTATEEIKKAIRKKPKIKESLKDAEYQYLSTGLTQLNLACSGKTSVGLKKGHFYLFVGDSQAGKSWLCQMVLAEAAINPTFADYRLIFDNPERGVLMEVEKYFGKGLAERSESPKNGSSRTIEDFYDNVDDAVKDSKPFIYVLDSEDALTSEDEVKKAVVNKRIRQKNKEGDGEEKDTKGSYGDGKAKKNSSGLRVAHGGLEATGSILIIIKQTRDNIGHDAMFNPKTRSGGRALTFYASLELWFSIKGKLKKNYRGKPRTIGNILRIQVKKNRISGGDHSVDVCFYKRHGFDDTGSMIDYLVEEEHWDCKGRFVDRNYKLSAPEFDFNGGRDELIRLIEDNNREKELRLLVSEVWHDIENAVSVTRKNRYL